MLAESPVSSARPVVAEKPLELRASRNALLRQCLAVVPDLVSTLTTGDETAPAEAVPVDHTWSVPRDTIRLFSMTPPEGYTRHKGRIGHGVAVEFGGRPGQAISVMYRDEQRAAPTAPAGSGVQ